MLTKTATVRPERFLSGMTVREKKSKEVITMAEQQKSLHEKLQSARVKLQKLGLRKSGINTHTQVRYWEQSDFVPYCNLILNEERISSRFTITNQSAVLSIHDWDSDAFIDFEMPFAQATLKGCHEIQNIGAGMTYCRRYLWMNAMELTENDVLDALPADAGEIVLNTFDNVTNLEDLKKEYLKAVKDHPAMRDKIVEMKDKRKKEIESEFNKFIGEQK